MSKDKPEIISDIYNYLKFYNEYKNYPVYANEVEHIDASFDFQETSAGKPDSIIAGEKQVYEKPVYEMKKANEDIVVEKPVSIYSPREDFSHCDSLDKFYEEIKDCRKCSHLAETRNNLVFGYGNPAAEIVVVGEAPGAEEDKQGKPFVGRAGKLLTDILKAIEFDREDVFICNILKCRPPENRNPLPGEIMNCEPYLFKQLELIKPKMILALGTFAGQTLLKSKEPLGKLRGSFHEYNGIKLLVTYHPAALLRNPNWKKPTWEDVKLFRKEFDSMKK